MAVCALLTPLGVVAPATAWCADPGIAVSGAPAEQLRRLQVGAQQGDAASQGSLAEIYLQGVGVPADYARALAWGQKAAAQGEAHGELVVGMIYMVGKGVAVNKTEAATWLRKAAEQGLALAQYNLAVLYDKEGLPIDKSDPRYAAIASRLAELAKKTGQPPPASPATFDVTDRAEAARWYQAAADQGVAAAMLNLATLYLNVDGNGLPKDPAKALALLRKAAAQPISADNIGAIGAAVQLGILYERGDVVRRDDAEAEHWYCKAAQVPGAVLPFTPQWVAAKALERMHAEARDSGVPCVAEPVVGAGLAMQNTKSTRTNGGSAILLEGTVANLSSAPREVPRLKAVVRSAAQQDLKEWSFATGVSVLQPGATVNFRFELSDPPQGATDVMISFAR